MNNKKNKIYIAVIVVCLVAAGGVIYFGFGFGTSVDAPSTVTPEVVGGAPEQAVGNTRGKIPTQESTITYPAPRVFPQETNLDLSVFDSAAFTSLKDYPLATVEPGEIGKDNPFK